MVNPATNWRCKCLTINKFDKKRCGSCMRWRKTSSVEDVEIAAATPGDEATGGDGALISGGNEEATDREYSYHRVSLEQAAAHGCQKCQQELETGEKTSKTHDDHCLRKDMKRAKKKSSSRKQHVHVVTLEQAAAHGCQKCQQELETGEKTDGEHDDHCLRKDKRRQCNYHRVTLEQAAEQGCSKCKKQLETGIKTARSHDVGCPRSRGARSFEASGSELNASTSSSATDQLQLEEGDPPWRTKGNGWIGRRIIYRPDMIKEETRSCSKNKFYDEDGTIHVQQASSSGIKGTILAFISERDKDSNGNPGFVSTRNGKPAMLFHVVFDRGNELRLLNKDFEEFEIKEQCEWVYDESDTDDDESEMQQEDDEKKEFGDEDDMFEFKEDKLIREKPKVKNVQVKDPPANQVTPKTDSVESIDGKKVDNSRVTSSSKREADKEEKMALEIQTNATSVRAPTDQASSKDSDATSTKRKAASDGSVPERAGPQKENQENSSSVLSTKSSKPNFSDCSSFNEALKSALSTYASSSTFKSSNNPPPPLPPPFLSHHEESTLRTALAFVMIKARNKQKAANPTVARRLGEATSIRPLASTLQAPIGRGGLGRIRGEESERSTQASSNTSLIGGLLSLARRQEPTQSTTNTMIMFEREMNNVRDILQLALSSILPLYSGALETKEDDGNSKRLLSAVYDFKASYNDPYNDNKPQKSLVESHYASLDGLCQHATIRLARIINETEMKIRIEERAKKSKSSKIGNEASQKSADSQSNENPEASIVTESSQAADSHRPAQHKHNIRDAIVKLFHDDIIGKAYCHQPIDGHLSEEIMTISRIGRIMGACHVIHRLLFFDSSHSFATECVIAISCTLAELYNNNYSAVFSDSKDSKTAQQTDKSKVQVVQPNWISHRTMMYSDDRNERRSRGIDTMFCDKRSASAGAKRKDFEPVREGQGHPLPDVSDVLAVNLLRLLECVIEMRLHNHQKRSNSNMSADEATKILKEIRSTDAVGLIMPLHLDEAATFYFRESQALKRCSRPPLLRTSAKLMLRIHFFSLIRKLSSYERL